MDQGWIKDGSRCDTLGSRMDIGGLRTDQGYVDMEPVNGSEKNRF